MSSSVDKYFDLLESGGYVTSSTNDNPKVDSIVEAVKDKYDSRSRKGIETYKTTLQDNPDGFYAFLNHLQEELMDATLYIEKLKRLNR